MAGPQRARLDQGLTGAHDDSVRESAQEWVACAKILRQISMALLTASPEVKQRIGGQTGPAIDAAFQTSSEGMSAKGAELIKGATALQAAADAIETARTEQEHLKAHPLSEPTVYSAPGQPTEQQLKHEASSRQAHKEYQAAYADQETRAQKKADHMDKVFEHSTAVMKEIHGEPDKPWPPDDEDQPTGPGRGNNDNSGNRPTGITPTHHDNDDDTTIQPIRDPQPTDDGTDDVPIGTVPDDGGTSQGTFPTPTPVPGTDVAPPTPGTSSPGVGGSTGLGLAGAAAGGIGGGALSAGLATSGIRGGGVAPISTGGSTATSGVRGIGATSRSGASGTLGRGAGVTPTGAGAGASSRGGGARSSGVAGRGGGSRGGTGSRGGAGGRGAATGAAAGGRSGRSKDDEKKKRSGDFDDSEDWIDDEDVAPGVLD